MNIKKTLKKMKVKWKLFCAAFYIGYLNGRYSDFELDWVVQDKVLDFYNRTSILIHEAEELEIISHEAAKEFYAIGA